MRIVILVDGENKRSKIIAKALWRGARAVGHEAVTSAEFQPCDVLASYGWRFSPAFRRQRALGRPFVHVDLGYWGRKPPDDPFRGYHKVAVNARHPQAFRRGYAADRLSGFDLSIRPWRREGGHIVIAGMSAKSALDNGFAPEEWERRAIGRIRTYTKRPIVYRPKPSWKEARPIPGTMYSPADEPIEKWLDGAHALVTHHSNAAVDALVAGVPVYVEEGVAAGFSMRSLDFIDDPPLPDGREALLADVAYCQWSVAEMRDGTVWQHLEREGRF